MLPRVAGGLATREPRLRTAPCCCAASPSPSALLHPHTTGNIAASVTMDSQTKGHRRYSMTQHDTAESGQRRVFANTKPPDSKAGFPWVRLRSTSRSSTAPSARVLSMLCLAHSYTSHNPGLQNSSSRAWQGSAHLRRRECSSSGTEPWHSRS